MDKLVYGNFRCFILLPLKVQRYGKIDENIVIKQESWLSSFSFSLWICVYICTLFKGLYSFPNSTKPGFKFRSTQVSGQGWLHVLCHCFPGCSWKALRKADSKNSLGNLFCFLTFALRNFSFNYSR